MIKNCLKRKIIITTFALCIFLLTLTFPRTEDEINKNEITMTSLEMAPIYLLNKKGEVSRTSTLSQEKETISHIKEIISSLTIDEQKSFYIPSLFSPVIPNHTKVIHLTLENKILKIDFSKELLNIPQDHAEKMIECLVYSLTELKEVKGLILYVEGNLLETIPNTDIRLPSLLTRDIGVNKEYNITDVKNIISTTVYYIAKENNLSYYVPVTLFSNDSNKKIDVVIERLKSKSELHTNLMSYLNASAELTNYELLEEEVKLSFNDYLYEGLVSDEIKSEVQYSISLSMMDTLHVKSVSFMNESSKN